MSKHTEWHLIPDGMLAVSDNTGMHSLIADLSNSGLPRQEVEDAVKRLVTCWNEHDDLVKERDELIEALSATQRILGKAPLSKESSGRWLKNIKLLEKYPEAS